MTRLTNWYYATADLVHAGGPVMPLLALVIGLTWLLTFERLLFLTFTYRHLAAEALSSWRARADRHTWNSEQIRDAALSRLNDRAWSSIPLIKSLVAICPLLGLFGTVTGMITIFDVMSIAGTSNARSMAEGVSRATISTMAGMVAALAGVLGVVLVASKYEDLRRRLRDAFSLDAPKSTAQIRFRRARLSAPLRIMLSAALAMLTTAALLTLMQVLIASGKSAITETNRVYFTEFVRLRDEQPLQRKKRELSRPEAVEKPPEFEQRSDTFADLDGDNVISVAVPRAQMSNSDFKMSGLAAMPVSDGDYLPIVKVTPMYPRQALLRELEGYVLLQFTVTTVGTVRDVVVVESTSPIFERSAIQAALKFKYKPRIIDGEPIEVYGVLNKITFEMLR